MSDGKPQRPHLPAYIIRLILNGYHDSEFELTAEELQEEQEDAAIRIIQRAYRGKRAIQLLKQLIRANYVKIRDPDFENGFLYKNKATGNIHS